MQMLENIILHKRCSKILTWQNRLIYTIGKSIGKSGGMMKYAYLLVLLFVLLVPFGAAHSEPVCPPTDTGSPPATDTPAPPPVEPTPSSPPEETAPPPEWTGTPWLQTQYPSITPGTPAPDPSPSATGGAGQPTREKHPKTPTPNMVMPDTGPFDDILPLFYLGFGFFAVAFIAGMVRRARHE